MLLSFINKTIKVCYFRDVIANLDAEQIKIVTHNNKYFEVMSVENLRNALRKSYNNLLTE